MYFPFSVVNSHIQVFTFFFSRSLHRIQSFLFLFFQRHVMNLYYIFKNNNACKIHRCLCDPCALAFANHIRCHKLELFILLWVRENSDMNIRIIRCVCARVFEHVCTYINVFDVLENGFEELHRMNMKGMKLF